MSATSNLDEGEGLSMPSRSINSSAAKKRILTVDNESKDGPSKDTICVGDQGV